MSDARGKTMIWSGIEFGLGVGAAWFVLGTAISVIWVSFLHPRQSEDSSRLVLAEARKAQMHNRRLAPVVSMSRHIRYR
jgi:hypothetical protein